MTWWSPDPTVTYEPAMTRNLAEITRQSRPYGVVVALPEAGVHRLRGRQDRPAALEHERKRAVELLRCQFGGRRPGVGVGVRAVAGERVVQRAAARGEALRLRVVLPRHQAHVLGHHVAVEPPRAGGVLADQPARREDH